MINFWLPFRNQNARRLVISILRRSSGIDGKIRLESVFLPHDGFTVPFVFFNLTSRLGRRIQRVTEIGREMKDEMIYL